MVPEKAPGDVIRSCIARLHERAHKRDVDYWAATSDHKPSPADPAAIEEAEVKRGTTEWDYTNLDEFLAEYASEDCRSASVGVSESAAINDWRLTFFYLAGGNVTHADLTAHGDHSKADILYILEPYDAWHREVEAQQKKERQEKEAAAARSHETAIQLAMAAPVARRKRWLPAVNWQSVTDNIVAWIILSLILLGVATLVVRNGVG